MNDIMKVVQALKYSNILLKGVTKTIKNETKEQKGGFLSMLLGTLGASLLGNVLAGKGTVRAGYGNKEGKGMLRVGYRSKTNFWFHLILQENLKFKNIIEISPDLMELFQEITCLMK